MPVDPDALGRDARATLPTVVQAVVTAPSGTPRADLEQRLLLARRRVEIAARAAGLDELRGGVRVVPDRRLQGPRRRASGWVPCTPTCCTDLPLSHAVFHQRYATNTHPTWALAQPFRVLAHNGEINTVRGNREQVRGRRARLGGRIGDRLAALGPLLDEGASDSLSLDEALQLLVASGWRLDAALLVAIPDAAGLRTDVVPELDALRRRAAGLLAPWDGPAALCFSDGIRVGAMLDRNGLRPLSVTRHRVRPRGRRLRGRRRCPSTPRRPSSDDAWAPARSWSWTSSGTSSATTARPARTRPAPRVRAESRRQVRHAARRPDRARVAAHRRARRRAPRSPARWIAGLDAERAAAGHQDHGPRGARAAVEHGRRHADARAPRTSTGRSPTTCARASRR